MISVLMEEKHFKKQLMMLLEQGHNDPDCKTDR